MERLISNYRGNKMSDLQYIKTITLFALIYTLFIGIYTTNELTDSGLYNSNQDFSLLDFISNIVTFLNPFTNLNSEVSYINITLFAFIGIIGIVLILRYIRGQ